MMSYTMSWERTRNVWDEFDNTAINDFDTDTDESVFIDTPTFDPDEIL
jgi:hypothetical protein